MGRAIDMEKDIDALKIKVEKLENTVRGMCTKLDELDEKSTKTKHIDITEEVKEKKNGKKKANNKGSSSKSKRSDAEDGDTKVEDDGDGDSSK